MIPVIYNPDSDQNTIPDSPIVPEAPITVIQSSMRVELDEQNTILTRKVRLFFIYFYF